MGVSETYFLRVGPQGRLFPWLKADDAGGSEETGFVKLLVAHRGQQAAERLLTPVVKCASLIASTPAARIRPHQVPCEAERVRDASATSRNMDETVRPSLVAVYVPYVRTHKGANRSWPTHGRARNAQSKSSSTWHYITLNCSRSWPLACLGVAYILLMCHHGSSCRCMPSNGPHPGRQGTPPPRNAPSKSCACHAGTGMHYAAKCSLRLVSRRSSCPRAQGYPTLASLPICT